MPDALELRLREDRSLRDASRALVQADIAYLKGDLSAKGIGGRVADRLSEGAIDVFEEATQAAENNKGVLITLIAAVGIWFARNPIMELFSDDAGENADVTDDDFTGEAPDQD